MSTTTRSSADQRALRLHFDFRVKLLLRPPSYPVELLLSTRCTTLLTDNGPVFAPIDFRNGGRTSIVGLMTARVALPFLIPALALATSADGWEQSMTKAAELTSKGRFSAADKMYVAARAAAVGTPTPELAESVTRVAIGKLRFQEGRTDEAEQIWRFELARLESRGLPTVPAVLLHLSDLYIFQRRYAVAEEMLVRCAQHRDAVAGGAIVTALTGLGTVYASQARYGEAAAALAEALSLVSDSSGDRALDVAVIEYKLAGVYSRVGRAAEADDLFERSLRRATQHLRFGDVRLRVPMTEFAEHLQRTGRKQRAKELRKAAKLLQGQYGNGGQHTVDIRSLQNERSQ